MGWVDWATEVTAVIYSFVPHHASWGHRHRPALDMDTVLPVRVSVRAPMDGTVTSQHLLDRISHQIFNCPPIFSLVCVYCIIFLVCTILDKTIASALTILFLFYV